MSGVDDFNKIFRLTNARDMAKISNLHSLPRESYQLLKFEVSGTEEMNSIITDYVKHHLWQATKTRVTDYRALALAEGLLRKKNMSLKSIYVDCLYGRNHGIKRVLDVIQEGFEREALQEYINYVLKTVIDNENFGQIRDLMVYVRDKHGAIIPDIENRPIDAMMAEWNDVVMDVIMVLDRLLDKVGV